MSAPAEERIDSVGGVKIHVRSWQPEGRKRGVVVVCHGVNSHGGQYLWTGEQLQARGFAVYALDLRGRGRSDGPRFTVSNISEYVSDVAATIRLAKQREGAVPLFLLGHSAGGVTSVSYALDHQAEISGLICESFAYRVPAPAPALAVIKALGAIAPGLPVLKLQNRDFTRDPDALRALESDPLTRGEIQPAVTVAALVRATERMKREFPRIALPVFILHGTLDKATVPAGSQEFYDRAGSKDKTLKFYEGHSHDLLNDVGKDAVLADVVAWIEARLPA